jgi:hypothetical protein
MPHGRDDSQRFDDSVWLDLFKPLHYARDTGVADRVAKLLDYLLLELEDGPMGVTNAAESIENALRLIFPFTGTGRACMILFQVSLGNEFPTQDDSLATIAEAMKRTRTAPEGGPVRQAKEQGKHPRRRK